MLAGPRKQRQSLLGLPFAALLAALVAFAPAVQAKVVKTDKNPQLSTKVPVTQWADDTTQARAVVIAIHGLVLHGGTYDAMARSLAAEGIVVAAPDLRGYGRWISDRGDQETLRAPINYKRSHADLVALTRQLKTTYPDVPLFGIGESLGADMLLHVAVDCPKTLDGIILSAPAVKHRWFVADILRNAPAVISKPFKQIDMSPHIQKYFSNDARITDAAVGDPLVRKRMSTIELLRSTNEVDKCLKYAKNVSPNLPVLVMQASDDQMLRSEAVADLLVALPSRDQTLEWFGNRGHLLLETPFVHPDTMAALTTWLNGHVDAKAHTAAVSVVANSSPTGAAANTKSHLEKATESNLESNSPLIVGLRGHWQQKAAIEPVNLTN